MNQFKKDKKREGITGFFQQNCDFADFLPQMKTILEENNPDVVCIGFERDPNTGTHFHSTLLPSRMSKLGYANIYRETKKGVSISKKEIASGALRLSVYTKKEYSGKIKRNKSYNCNYSVDGASAMSVTFSLDNEKVFTIINAYISFDHDSVRLSREAIGNDSKRENSTDNVVEVLGDPMIRQDALNYANMCYNGIIREMVLNEPERPDYVIMMGDLNYRINQMSLTAEMISEMFSKTGGDSTVSIAKEYYKQDELYNQMSKENIYKYDEGVENNGPMFAPVCVMRKDRDCENDYINCWEKDPDYILPSWCNRILYKSYHNDKMCCLKYDRFDHGKTMRKAKHAAVYAVFQIGNCGLKVSE
jgi:hypothetical protein